MTGPALHIALFGHDSAESTLLKRGDAFVGHGCTVQGFMFRRARPGAVRRPSFSTVDLGETTDRNYLRRLPVLGAGILRALRRRDDLRRADVVYARNVDMLLVALVAVALARATAPVVYEVLDVQRPFLRSDGVGALFRWFERQALRRCPLLVVSSPAFVDYYFGPRQGRRTGLFLLENKLGASNPPPLPDSRKAGPPWHIGWFGTLRCRRSFAILRDLADTLGDRVVIHLAGRPSPVDITIAEIETVARARSNFVYHGAYDSPGDLPALYGLLHFSWCVDYIDQGTNSTWLLPNRLYEGGRYGAVALAQRDTATGRRVLERDLGWAFAEPLVDEVRQMLAALTPERYADAAAAVARLPAATFVDSTDTATLLTLMRRLRSGQGSPAIPADPASALLGTEVPGPSGGLGRS